MGWAVRNRPAYITCFQSAILLPYQEFPRGSKIACGEGIEIDTACKGIVSVLYQTIVPA